MGNKQEKQTVAPEAEQTVKDACKYLSLYQKALEAKGKAKDATKVSECNKKLWELYFGN